ncbi:hypothetical protein N7495_002807 [Penicillium taxi]|uniref:uncharacterized protein n=1 Tax=Penicillium taxi TaxID=168475 RepID=UPI00254594FE|nr:uncharacterized protein N7495_002807 [Penicillium taxi]KAJ5902279.1 hypothetical protein N7495_002807 [Penicillium taxi]
MSPPTRQLNRLSIGAETMSEARAQSTDDEGGYASGSAVRGRSGITYDLSNLDSDAKARALVGLTRDLEVVNCSASPAGYEFQIIEHPRVYLSEDSYTCTCPTFQRRPDVACHHIFGVIDQVRGCIDSRPSTSVTLTKDGHPQLTPRIEDLLKGQLDVVAGRLNWQHLRVDEDGRKTGMTREQRVRDVMSAFDKQVLPEDYRQDLKEKAEQGRTPEQCVVQGDFEATIFRLAVHDDSLFSSLGKVMPAGACAAIYFDKIQEHIRRLLADFDRYCATGEIPAEASAPSSVEVDDVVHYLRRAVDLIHDNITSRSPYGAEGATAALVTILEAVVSRNKDALEGNTWGCESFHGEDEDQRNLYHLLIGSEDMDLDPNAKLFILDALEVLPPSDLMQWVQRLRDAQGRIEVNRAPKLYLLKLGAIVRMAESAATGPSGQKRPAVGSSGGYSKRSR